MDSQNVRKLIKINPKKIAPLKIIRKMSLTEDSSTIPNLKTHWGIWRAEITFLNI